MTCATCVHWLLRTSAGKQLPMAKHGFGECAPMRAPWTTYPPQHTCPKHKEAAPDVVNARAVWLGKLSASRPRNGG